MKTQFYLIIICLGFAISCTTEIPLDTDFDAQIFIDGYLVNDSNYIAVDIQSTVPVDRLTLDPINDAILSLYSQDQNGNTFIVTDNFNITEGVYTSNDKIATKIGNDYWIEVQTTDGNILKSDQERLKAPILISEVVRVDGKTRIIFNDPKETANFYLARFDFYQDGEFIHRVFELSSDALYNGNEMAFIESSEIIGDAIYVEILNLNFKTYQFYLNSFEQYDNNIDYEVESGDPTQLFLSPPSNLIGNITNITKNRMELGFFGVFSFRRWYS